MNELKPCPFCGNSKLRVYNISTNFILCLVCKAQGPEVDHININAEEKAVELWNQRSEKK
jgi:Lar family restriction alleviation protein